MTIFISQTEAIPNFFDLVKPYIRSWKFKESKYGKLSCFQWVNKVLQFATYHYQFNQVVNTSTQVTEDALCATWYGSNVHHSPLVDNIFLAFSYHQKNEINHEKVDLVFLLKRYKENVQWRRETT